MFLLLPRFSNLLLAVRAAPRRGRAENAGYVWGGEVRGGLCLSAEADLWAPPT